MTLFLLGVLVHAIVLYGLFHSEGRCLGQVSSVVGSVLSVVGVQTLLPGLHAKTHSWSRRFDPNQQFLVSFYRTFNLEAGLLLGGTMASAGAIVFAVITWNGLNPDLCHCLIRNELLVGGTLVIIGLSVLFSSIFISAMSITKDNEATKGLRIEK